MLPLADFVPIEEPADTMNQQVYQNFHILCQSESQPQGLKSALEELAEAIDCHIAGVSSTNRGLVLTKTLHVLGELTGKKPKKPLKEMRASEMVTHMEQALPVEYRRLCGNGMTSSREGLLMRGMAKYIVVLKQRKDTEKTDIEAQQLDTTQLQRVTEVPQGIAQCATIVEQTLEKIEHWCDGWLNGKVENWANMEQCLHEMAE